MKTLKKLVDLFLVIFAASLIVASSAHAAVSCHKINAKGAGQDLGGGVTEAQIIGGGLLHGTTQGLFVVTGVPPVYTIAGTVTFTTRQGILPVTVTGTFDVVTGNFIASGPVASASATGKLTGATGTLLFEGIEDFSTGKFVEDVKGLICLDLAP